MYSRPSTKTSWPDVIDLLSEITVFNHYDFDEFLQKLITIAQEVIPSDSCFIYFLDYQTKVLTLIAANKAHEHALGQISMQEGEGITGWVAAHKQIAVIEEKAYRDPRFKSFKQLPEDKYESFLSVPIFDATGVIGVMNFQHLKPYTFTQEQIRVISAITKIIASAFVKTVTDRKVTTLEGKLEERKVVEKAKGILMKGKNLSEDEAFRLIRSEAMNKRKSMREIAEAIILAWK